MSDLLAVYWATVMVYAKFAPATIIPCLITWRSTDRGAQRKLAKPSNVIIT